MEKSTIDVAIELMEKKKTPQPISKLLKEVSEITGQDDNPEFLSQLYIDIITTGRFVFCGDDLWDLKERHMDLWDKDGSFFNDKEAVEEEEETDNGLTVDDYNLDSADNEDLDDEDDDSIVVKGDADSEGEFGLHTVSDDEDEETEEDESTVEEEEDEDFDEEGYGKVMDDYEKYYDE